MSVPTLYIVHCIDTEGPLNELPEATVEQVNKIFGLKLTPSKQTLERLQSGELDLGQLKDAVAAITSPQRLAYNRDWRDVDSMLDEAMSEEFRCRTPDDLGNGWIYSWHCVDHLGLRENPRRKPYGYGEVFHHYRRRAGSGDEVNWHFHPLSLTRDALSGATSYLNSWDILSYVLCRRVLDDAWFPVVNRPGFHSERPDSHAFLEQWIPFDYANQFHEEVDTTQLDLQNGRFGDWSRAPATWAGYNPHHDDYQQPGQCRRWIFRCLNVGTRLRLLNSNHIRQAFTEARDDGSAILAFADHDYRDLLPDVLAVQKLLAMVKPDFPDVSIRYAGAEEAARRHLGVQENPALSLSLEYEDGHLIVRRKAGELFGPQPFLALKTRQGEYFHDNLDMIEPGNIWRYVLDQQTLEPNVLTAAGVGSAGRFGGFDVARISF